MTYKNAKTGILLILIGIGIALLCSILSFIGVFANGAANVASFLLIAVGILELIGVIFCGVSSSKNFKRALFILIAYIVVTLVGAILVACLAPNQNTQLAASILGTIFVVAGLVLNLVFTWSILLGLGEVTEDQGIIQFSKIVWKLCIADIIWGVVAAILLAVPAIAGVQAVVIVFSVLTVCLDLAFNICFLVLLIRSYRNVK